MPIIKDEWFCIVNPCAGSGKTVSEWIKAVLIFKDLDIPFRETLTEHKRHATEVAYTASVQGYRRILAVGGDGSVSETLDGIMKFCTETGTDPAEFYLGVLPIGSGNDWIKSTGVPHDVETAVQLLASESFRRQDIVSVESSSGVSYMLNGAGVGLDSHVCARVDRQKEQGNRHPLLYFKALLWAIGRLTPFRVKLFLDGSLFYEGGTYSIAFGNGRFSGGGMRQTPRAVMDDGLVDVMVVPAISLLKIASQIHRLFTGTADKSPCLHYSQAKEIILTADRNEFVEVDGELKGNLPLRISVTGSQINVLSINES